MDVFTWPRLFAPPCDKGLILATIIILTFHFHGALTGPCEYGLCIIIDNQIVTQAIELPVEPFHILHVTCSVEGYARNISYISLTCAGQIFNVSETSQGETFNKTMEVVLNINKVPEEKTCQCQSSDYDEEQIHRHTTPNVTLVIKSILRLEIGESQKHIGVADLGKAASVEFHIVSYPPPKLVYIKRHGNKDNLTLFDVRIENVNGTFSYVLYVATNNLTRDQMDSFDVLLVNKAGDKLNLHPEFGENLVSSALKASNKPTIIQNWWIGPLFILAALVMIVIYVSNSAARSNINRNVKEESSNGTSSTLSNFNDDLDIADEEDGDEDDDDDDDDDEDDGDDDDVDDDDEDMHDYDDVEKELIASLHELFENMPTRGSASGKYPKRTFPTLVDTGSESNASRSASNLSTKSNSRTSSPNADSRDRSSTYTTSLY